MSYCLDDGSELLYGPAASRFDEPATAIMRRPADVEKENTRLFSAASTAYEQKTELLPRDLNTQALSNSVAVLPFVNVSADEENEFFCDGLSEELLNALSRVEGLRVAARTSAFSFKGKNTDVREIGERLNVGKILEGSVRRSGDRLRISVQLVDVSDGYHIWSERYDRQMRDVFEIQDEITLAVVDALKVELLSGMRSVIIKHYTDDTEAYENYLKGRFHHYKYTADGWFRAIEYYERAIAKAPSYAPAYAGVTSAWGYLCFFGLVPANEAVPKMRAATEKALEHDTRLSEAYLSAAMVSFFYDWDRTAAEISFGKAIELDDGSAESVSFYAMFLAFQERYAEAMEQCQISLVRDPLSLLINMNAGWTYFTAGDLDKAHKIVDEMLALDPAFYGSYWIKGAIALTTGEYQAAVTELEKAIALGGHQTVLADLGSAYGLAGEKEKAEDVLSRLLELRENSYAAAICVARVYSRLGDQDKAVEWLETAFEERNGELLFLQGEMMSAPDTDPLRSLGSDEKVVELFRLSNI
jgi:serine/threonine-protein kinase